MSTSAPTFTELQKQKAALLQMLNETQQNIAKTQGMEGAIDIHHPELSPNWPRYKHQDYPRMLYHPTKLNPNVEAARKGIRIRNEKNPTLAPLDLPASQPLSIIVKDAGEEKAYREQGYVKTPPFLANEEETVQAVSQVDPLANPVADVTMCARGCGKPPHRGACSVKE